eukprot:5934756-Pyramimonas_sp.AAC.1
MSLFCCCAFRICKPTVERANSLTSDVHIAESPSGIQSSESRSRYEASVVSTPLDRPAFEAIRTP